jgi:hypothetical protein
MGKRRFICGFIQCLLPSLGSFDPLIRRPHCITILCCCFKGYNAQGDMLNGLLEYITQQLLPSKYVTFQL